MRSVDKRVVFIAVLIMIAAVAVSAGDKPWFDNANCAMCKNMSNDLMENTAWAQYNISKGIISVTSVPDKYVAEYRKAHQGMEQTGASLMKGEMLDLCGSCIALGACMMKGVNQEYVETPNGDIWIVTSDNPEVVAELHAWAKRNKDEMAKMKG